MNPHPDEVERSLAELTAWTGPEPGLWRAALEQHRSTPRRGLRALWSRPIAWPVRIAAAIAIAALLIGILLPAAGRPRLSSRPVAQSPAIIAAKPAYDEMVSVKADVFAESNDTGPWVAGVSESPQAVPSAAVPPPAPAQPPAPRSPDRVAASGERQVVRKATIELATPDVRAAFAKVSLIVSDASGEYVQESSLTGEGKSAQASMTLRVAAGRLPDALNELRTLGEVTSENTRGEDVTAQAIDLEARIRNEQRVEAELLQLLEKRSDAPLKDILELRDSLSGVRQSVERLTAQRDRLSRLVNLATILVLIRTPDGPAHAAGHSSLGEYFSKTIAAAWRSGLVFLADTVSTIVAILIGGLIWWALAAALLFWAYRHHRRRAVLPPA